MKRIWFAMLISAILLFTAGCGPSNNGSQAGDPHTGTLGIDVSFFQLPDTLYHGSPFSIILELSNKGAFSPSRGAIAIWFDGYDEHIIGLPTGSAYSFSQDLPGKTVYNLAGSTAIETIRDNVAVTLPEDVDAIQLPIQATVCYPYETDASFEVCVDPEPTKATRKACTPTKTLSVGNGQGGPIAITKIQQASMNNQVIFLITLKNAGKGSLISGMGDCRIPKFNEQNKLSSFSATLSIGSPLQCTPNPVVFYTDSTELICKGSAGGSGNAYKTVLRVTMGYNYRSSVAQTVNIKRM